MHWLLILLNLFFSSGDNNSITFEVEAYDGGFPDPFTDRVNVTVYLLNKNDEPPIISPNITQVPTIVENMEPGIAFSDLSTFTFDPDPGNGGLFNFSLEGIYGDFEDDTNASFSLSPSGILTAERTFDREEQPEGFILLVLTTDYGSPTESLLQNVTVAIGDENDNEPYFDRNVSSKIYELLPAGVVVYSQYTAIDLDIGINALLNYSIFDGDTYDSFTVDDNGTITTTKPLNKTDQRHYTLVIEVMDNGNLSFYGYGEIEIELLDYNDNAPEFHEPLFANISEADSVETIFYEFNATDADEGTNAEIIYFFAPNSTNFTYFDNVTNATVTRFSLVNETGELISEVELDREKEEEFLLSVIAVDLGQVPHPLTTTTTITVIIEDENDNVPYFLNDSYIFNVTENEELEIEIGEVEAEDDDATSPNNDILFSLSGPRSEGLYIDNTTGLITVGGIIDWEEGASFTINVIATDQGDPPSSGTATITIFIDDINDQAPIWNVTSLNLSVTENLDPGATVGFVRADDPDSEGPNSYVQYFQSLTFNTKYFELNSTTGKVTTLRKFNREARDSYSFGIMANDSGIPQLSAPATVYIEILDDNDHTPYFLQPLFTGGILENAPLGSLVLTVMADDEDIGSNAELTYSIPDPTYAALFSINTSSGELYTNATYDFESIKHYQFEIHVEDGGSPTRNAMSMVRVNILDFNDNAPVFSQELYSKTIVENVVLGTSLVQVSATDADSADHQTFDFLIEQSAISDHFDINPHTGVLVNVMPINREELGENITLTIIANNTASNTIQSTSVPVNIIIEDLNDQAPSFDPTIVIPVFENRTNGSILYTLEARDGDEGMNGTVTYLIVDGNHDGLFTLDSNTGEVMLIGELDYETQEYHYLSINATDGGNDPLYNFTTLIFQVLDSNDRPLHFASSSYTVTFSYSSSANTELLTLSVIDLDSEPEIWYSIESGNDLGYFALDSTSGVITLDQTLSMSQIGMEIPISVKATDGKFEDNATISFNIRGTTVPFFNSLSYSASASEDVSSTVTIIDLYTEVTTAHSANVFNIVSGDYGAFSMTNNGILTAVEGALDYEDTDYYQLTVSVSRGGTTSYAIVNVEITDVNEFAPFFSSSSYFAPVSERTAVKQTFFQLIAMDRDGASPANTVRYSISSGDENDVFRLQSSTGKLSLKVELDYNNVNDRLFVLNITASNKQSTPVLSTWTIVRVELMDDNGHDPIIDTTNLGFLIELNENINSTSIPIATASATDADLGISGDITYGLLGDHRYQDFVINPLNGSIDIGPVTLDYERQEAYSLIVVAMDKGVPQRSDTATVFINIVDENDNSPIWKQDVYYVMLSENTTTPTDIITVGATDKDPFIFSISDGVRTIDNANGFITYSIIDGDPLSQFAIDGEFGIVTLVSKLNREAQDFYNLTLNASDGGGRYALASLQVTVTDVNDVPPYFASSVIKATVPEDAPLDTFITQVTAMDDDTAKLTALSYSIIGGNDNHTFYMNETTAQVYLNQSIDREVISVYNITIQVEDGTSSKSLSGVTVLTINVLDLNEHPPKFMQNSYEADVFENVPENTFVVTVSTTDEDFGENATAIYSITAGNNDSVFAINSSSGEIFVAENIIDYEDIDYYELTIQAQDSGDVGIRLSSYVNVSIFVLDVNDNVPVFSEPQYTAHVFEDASPYTSVITVNVTDEDSDENQKISYSLNFNGDTEAENNFVIDSEVGVVSLSSSVALDFENRTSYTIAIIATDNGTIPLSSTVTLTVLIEDANDNYPIFMQASYQGTVLENTPNGTYVLSVEASDADSGLNSVIVYGIEEFISDVSRCIVYCPGSANLCGNLNSDDRLPNDTFTIDNTTGDIYSAVVFDREVFEVYMIVVAATDSSRSSPLSTTVCVYVEIIDVNDNTPLFNETSYQTKISEASVVGDFVIRVSTSDLDIGQNAVVMYSITDGSDHFTINSNTGVVMVLADLDRETRGEHNITVIATDAGAPPLSSTTTVNVIIADVNDNSPLFELDAYVVNISEATEIGTVAFTALAADRDIDQNGYITYSIVPDTVFSINSTTGVISTSISFDRETIDHYTATIVAHDGGVPTRSSNATLEVTITDVNDNAPVFDQSIYTFAITENDLPAMPILTLKSFDADIGDNNLISYSIVSIEPMGTNFSVNSSSGEITLNTALDAEAVTLVTITVGVENYLAKPRLSSNAIILVYVLNINDVTPQFELDEYTTAISEAAAIGYVVTEVTAFDLDDGDTLTYSIIDSLTNASLFDIDNVTGEIFVNANLDYETISEEILTVLVEDEVGHSDEVEVFIYITNINDNPPVFQKANYSFEISENLEDEAYVGTVIATDPDMSNITYSISGDSYFTINDTTGDIYTSMALDREAAIEHSMTITASDDTELVTSVPVIVTVLDVNDNYPQFSSPQFTLEWAENTTIGTSLGVIGATDIDDKENQELSYFIEAGPSAEYFGINEQTGELYLMQEMDRELQDIHTINVTAYDAGSPSLSTTVKVTVVVLDVNDNIPIFNQTLYTAILYEDTEVVFDGILFVYATDRDIDDNAEVYYNISTPEFDNFDIDPVTGSLNLVSSLDYEIAHNHTFDVIVTDYGNPELSSTSQIFIEVLDVNDNSPYFEKEFYEISIPENLVLNTPIFTVPAIDIDDGLNGKLMYSILSGNLGFNFALDENTGILITNDYIDYETEPSFSLSLRVIDLGTPQYTATTTLNIEVIDENDHSPEFSTKVFTISISEATPINTSIFTLIATDEDSYPSANLTYEILSGDPMNHFSINNSTGVVHVNDEPRL